MKKIFIVLLSCLLISFGYFSTVNATTSEVDVNIKIEEANGKIAVTIPNDEIYSIKKPSISVKTGFNNAKVECDDVVVDSSIANGEVTFTIAKGNATYVIREVSDGNNTSNEKSTYVFPKTGIN